MNEKQMRVECAHGYGNAQGPRRTRGAVGAAHGATQGCESSLLSTLEPIAGGEPLRRVRGRAVPAVLCQEARSAEPRAGVYFRLLLIGYFEGIDSERGMAWRASDSLALRRFLRVGLEESPPDHSTISRTRRLIDVETHREVFTWVLGVLAEKGLLKGKTLGIDATTLEANAALRTIVRRDTGEGYQEFLKRLAQESGIATPTREQLARLDRKRAHKGSNEEWEHPHDPDARIAKMKDGRTHLAHKVEQAVDFSSGAVVAVNLGPADAGDTRTVGETVCEAGVQIATVAGEAKSEGVNPEGPKEVVLDKGYHSNEVLAKLAEWEVRSYCSEPERGRRRWEGKP